VADGAAAEVQDHILARIGQKLVHLARMDPALGDGHHLVGRCPVVFEEEPFSWTIGFRSPRKMS
jgi:hypothetical protein